MSDGNRSGVNWMRESCASRFFCQTLDGARLGEARQALDQKMTVGDEAEDQALDHRLLADDRLRHARFQRQDIVPGACRGALLHVVHRTSVLHNTHCPPAPLSADASR
jgi:hypothetical protein